MSEYDEYLSEDTQNAIDTPGHVMEDMNRESALEAEEIPPEPGDPDDLGPLPLAQREQLSLASMTPEQRTRYAEATASIMSHPAVQRLAASEAHHSEKMEHYRAEFLKAMKKEKA